MRTQRDLDDDSYYEYMREKFEREQGFWDYGLDDTLSDDEEKWRLQFDGFRDSE